uniref:Putative LAGLIDADG homing endonuclease n=1 Tax=Jenufa minuta TaxID=993092 RepID=A0A0S2LP45_JENMI|nr:putative LAGLIDADG homing endonuclease [Jenufa minuta]YP_009184933.1 putative LAGLIDADG homing endonuclease [Jenufa minuta]ALO63011.1 putative LAGLIDADG homing endonuclease [Jenufa minuta]ALO63014.1 putative LAGLIDADG homing endonuclease [Jenufa minuta]
MCEIETISRKLLTSNAYIMNFDVKHVPPHIGYYLAGFIDAEGSFCVSFSPKTSSEGKIMDWQVRPVFSVSQKERPIIALFKRHLKCGTVRTDKRGISVYEVTSKNALCTHIVPFFKKYGFLSAKKKRDFSSFCQILKILENFPLTKQDISHILALRINTPVIIANRRYSDKFILSSLHQSIHIDVITQSSETNTPNSLTINEMIESDLCGDTEAQTIYPIEVYLTGLCDGDGSFNVSFTRRDDYKLGWKISPSFSVSQRDKTLLMVFQKTLDCGRIRKGSSEGIWYLEVLNLDDLREKIIPFFKKFPFLSERKIDQFQRFCETLKILERKPRSRNDVVKILELQRFETSQTRWTTAQILERLDQFLNHVKPNK